MPANVRGMTSKLTPFDTGARLEPHAWTGANHGDLGKVDFDDDEGRTVVTVYGERSEVDGSYVLRVVSHGVVEIVVERAE